MTKNQVTQVVDSVQYLALAPAPGLEHQGQEFRAVNLSTQPAHAQSSFEVTVFDHQDAAITLSSLEQVIHHTFVKTIKYYLSRFP